MVKRKSGNPLAGNRDSRKPYKVKQFTSGGQDIRNMDRTLRDQFVSGAVALWTAYPDMTAEQVCVKYANTKGMPRAFWATLSDSAKRRVVGSVVYAKNTTRAW